MAKIFNEFGKFVRLKLVGEIVEVVGVDSTEITVKYLGHCFTTKHYRVSPVTSEEAAAAASQVDKPKSEKLKQKVDERVFIFQNGTSGVDSWR